MQPVLLKPDIYWVGAVDFNLRNFHHYSESPHGSTYNAYLVMDEKKVLFDSVSHEYGDELLDHISEIVNPCEIDYIVCNHLEQDHSGVLPRMVATCKPEKIFCSPMGLKSITGQFDTEGWPIQVVKDGESISIGKRTITFYETRMLHWPDSMVSYLNEDKVLISNDAFGQNVATSFRFADQYDRGRLLQAMKDYYYNIVLPFSPQVIKVLDRFAAAGLELDIVAPDHGLIFRTPDDIAFLLNSYRMLAEQRPQKNVLIAYDSMWGATSKMAYSIGQGLDDAGVPYTLMSLQRNHCSTVMAALADCGALIVGSSTRNNMPMVNMIGLLAHIKGLRPKNRIGAAFGSHGWSGEAPKQMADQLTEMGIEVVAEPLRISYGPKPADRAACYALGKSVAQALKAKLGE